MLFVSMSLRKATRGCVYGMDQQMKLREGLQARYAYEVRSVSCIYRASLSHSLVYLIQTTTYHRIRLCLQSPCVPFTCFLILEVLVSEKTSLGHTAASA